MNSVNNDVKYKTNNAKEEIQRVSTPSEMSKLEQDQRGAKKYSRPK